MPVIHKQMYAPITVVMIQNITNKGCRLDVMCMMIPTIKDGAWCVNAIRMTFQSPDMNTCPGDIPFVSIENPRLHISIPIVLKNPVRTG